MSREREIKIQTRQEISINLALMAAGILSAFIASYPPGQISWKDVYSNIFSSTSAAFIITGIMRLVRLWFLFNSRDFFLRNTEMVKGSIDAGLSRVHMKMSDLRPSDWIKILKEAHEQVEVMGRTLHGWKENSELEAIIRQKIIQDKVSFKWLLMGLGNRYLPMLNENDKRITRMLQDKVSETTKMLLSIRDELPEKLRRNFEIRFFEDVPLYFSYTRIDNKILIGHYFTSTGSQESPVSELANPEGRWFRLHSHEFKSIWSRSKNVRREYSERSQKDRIMGELILNKIQAKHEHSTKVLTKESKATIYNFVEGWDFLIKKFVDEDLEDDKKSILRDYTYFSHSALGLQCWDLKSYTGMITAGFQKAYSTGLERGAHFLIMCEALGGKNAIAERFLESVLSLIYSSEGAANEQFGTLFMEWKRNFEKGDNPLKIRLTCRNIMNALSEGTMKAPALEHPFNIYGDIAVSDSILGTTKQMGSPSPHIEVLWDKDEIRQRKEQFNMVWEASREFQERIFQTLPENLLHYGNGSVFDEWAKLGTR